HRAKAPIAEAAGFLARGSLYLEHRLLHLLLFPGAGVQSSEHEYLHHRLRARHRGRAPRSAVPGPVDPGTSESPYLVFVFLLSIVGTHLPSGPCVSILKVYEVGESSLIVTRDLTFFPPIMPSS